MLAAAALGAAVPASAQLLYENGSGGSVRFYGQFSPAYQYVDDGVQSTSTFVDNAHSNSRVGVLLTQPYGQNTFTFNFETALGLRSSDAVNQTATPKGISWSRTNLRKIDFALASQSWGKIYAGQGSMATDGIAESDFGSNGMTTYNGVGDGAGNFQFRTAAGALSGVTIASVAPSLDGGRRGRVRYDTPSFNGFKVSVAAGTDVLTPGNNDKYYDVALRYERDFNGTELTGGIGWSRRDRNGIDRDDTFGSVAVKLQSGVNFAVAAGDRKNSGSYYYLKAGYEVSMLPIGDTSFAVDYYDGEDFGLAGRQSKVYGLGINQDIDSINTQVYLGWRTYELSDPGVAYNDIDSILFGARWKF